MTGSVIARVLAESGYCCNVLEKARHVAGNCHTERESSTGILMHAYGPHTLHSDNNDVWSFLSRFTVIQPYHHRKQAWANKVLYPFPINLTALKLFFGKDLSLDQISALLTAETRPYANSNPSNFEEAALAAVGSRIYEAFYRGYTKKQWGRDPKTLPPFVFRRLPVYLDDDRNVFHHQQQGQPLHGYTNLVENMLDHKNIKVYTNCKFDRAMFNADFQHLFFSGPLDEYFDWSLGRLHYRTLDFKTDILDGTYQECGTVNYCDEDIPYTRVIEHKHFWPWAPNHSKTVITYEYPRECRPGDTPFYPIHLSSETNHLYKQYTEQARHEQRTSFVGRLGTYRYLDMDKAIEEALYAVRRSVMELKSERSIPAFFHE